MTNQYPRATNVFHHPMVKALKALLNVIVLSLLLTACAGGNTPPTTQPAQPGTLVASITPTAFQPVSPTDTFSPLPSLSPTQPPYKIWLPPYLPEAMRNSISLPEGYILAGAQEEADLSLSVSTEPAIDFIQWIYSLVAPFPTVTDGIAFTDLQAAWTGKTNTLFNGSPILMDDSTSQVLNAYWGPPAPDIVQVMPVDQLIDYAWSNRPAWAIVPFESLEPRWKVLNIDGQSPIHKDFDPASYPLAIPFTISGDLRLLNLNFSLPSTNRDELRLTTVAMTGVTAMVRATAATMEQKGITYPAQDIGSLLASADITHISNEIPFSPDCPFPSPTLGPLIFCSSPKYIDLLKAVGTDIIELTGDHFMDYGADATLYTLQMYKDLGWPYFGGGANAEEARQPVMLENNGNKIAFMGCNVGCQVKTAIPCDAIATNDHPGAAQCDFDYINSEIPALRDEGYLVIFTFQHIEYYTYTTEPILAQDFGLAASAGAAIVSGSQAHQPHGFAFENGSFIHYGLGNLFFDQFHYCAYNACDDAFIDRHVFYNGHYISTELITIRFVDFARPRLMTPEERLHFLEIIFEASSW